MRREACVLYLEWDVKGGDVGGGQGKKKKINTSSVRPKNLLPCLPTKLPSTGTNTILVGARPPAFHGPLYARKLSDLGITVLQGRGAENTADGIRLETGNSLPVRARNEDNGRDEKLFASKWNLSVATSAEHSLHQAQDHQQPA